MSGVRGDTCRARSPAHAEDAFALRDGEAAARDAREDHADLIMKTQYFTACSLDGFIAAPGDSLDWLFSLGNATDTSYPTFIEDVG
jgi:hypothetical protein